MFVRASVRIGDGESPDGVRYATSGTTRTLRDLDQLHDRMLADIGLDRSAPAALIRGITKQA